MKSPNLCAQLMTGMALLASASCASTTMLRSSPPGAKAFVDGEMVGTTPCSYTDTAVVGTSHSVRLVKEGYDDFSTSFSRSEKFSVGACAGGVFTLVPFLWIMDYKAEHSYDLSPATQSNESSNAQQHTPASTFEREPEVAPEPVHVAPPKSKAHPASKPKP